MKKRKNRVMLSLTDDEHALACRVAGTYRMPVAKFLRLALFHKEFREFDALSESNRASIAIAESLQLIKTLKPTPELVTYVVRMEAHLGKIARSLGERCYIESPKIRKRLKGNPDLTLSGLKT